MLMHAQSHKHRHLHAHRRVYALEKGMAAHSSIRAWRIPWTEEPWQATVHGVAKRWTQLSDSHTERAGGMYIHVLVLKNYNVGTNGFVLFFNDGIRKSLCRTHSLCHVVSLNFSFPSEKWGTKLMSLF